MKFGLGVGLVVKSKCLTLPGYAACRIHGATAVTTDNKCNGKNGLLQLAKPSMTYELLLLCVFILNPVLFEYSP
mgnify:CR=1 FL=1